jgi:hypothetical protein
MEDPKNTNEPDLDDALPPMFKSWSQMYTFVLIMHVIIIVLFYLFTRAFS